MKKNPEQTETTDSNFQEAFWNLYTNKSIDKITVKDICTLAGYNRSTFYQYYTDIYDLLHKSEARTLEGVYAFVISLVEQANNMNAAQVMQAIFELFAQNNKFISILFGAHGDAEFVQKVVESLKPLWIKYFFINTNNSQAEVDLLMDFYIFGIISMYQKWFSDPNGISFERIVSLSFQTLPNTSCFENFDKELRGE
ncbi:MAG: TetR-like C-terminal domain-containing protein [Mobilitalea sp.]